MLQHHCKRLLSYSGLWTRSVEGHGPSPQKLRSGQLSISIRSWECLATSFSSTSIRTTVAFAEVFKVSPSWSIKLRIRAHSDVPARSFHFSTVCLWDWCSPCRQNSTMTSLLISPTISAKFADTISSTGPVWSLSNLADLGQFGYCVWLCWFDANRNAGCSFSSMKSPQKFRMVSASIVVSLNV